ncbi:MAG: CPBP family intramembrane metalloprotease, partial [Vicinamibacterales bacterium]|nr:CPBP family intramembrane metalloprotease [Vicinamibacterales bacterium]
IALTLGTGFYEELWFRGAIFRLTEEWFGSWIAIVVSSLVFGFVHLSTEGATVMDVTFISIEAGLLLAAAYMLTRRLWLCIGFHAAWNFTQGSVFSGAVSGTQEPTGLIKTTMHGPELITGGNFGMEASVVALVLLTTTGVVMLVMAIRRGEVRSPMWTRRS